MLEIAGKCSQVPCQLEICQEHLRVQGAFSNVRCAASSVSKVKSNCTYTNTANYWDPLADKDNDDGYDKAVPAQQATINNISNAEVQRNL
jgi:hypothetical protein